MGVIKHDRKHLKSDTSVLCCLQVCNCNKFTFNDCGQVRRLRCNAWTGLAMMLCTQRGGGLTQLDHTPSMLMRTTQTRSVMPSLWAALTLNAKNSPQGVTRHVSSSPATMALPPTTGSPMPWDSWHRRLRLAVLRSSANTRSSTMRTDFNFCKSSSVSLILWISWICVSWYVYLIQSWWSVFSTFSLYAYIC